MWRNEDRTRDSKSQPWETLHCTRPWDCCRDPSCSIEREEVSLNNVYIVLLYFWCPNTNCICLEDCDKISLASCRSLLSRVIHLKNKVRLEGTKGGNLKHLHFVSKACASLCPLGAERGILNLAIHHAVETCRPDKQVTIPTQSLPHQEVLIRILHPRLNAPAVWIALILVNTMPVYNNFKCFVT